MCLFILYFTFPVYLGYLVTDFFKTISLLLLLNFLFKFVLFQLLKLCSITATDVADYNIMMMKNNINIINFNKFLFF